MPAEIAIKKASINVRYGVCSGIKYPDIKPNSKTTKKITIYFFMDSNVY